ncbi:uncharacterized protein [Scyliorhinus torazame]|uniref:uncharacterized protein n=1 Tax=Scyliorhinus torazame TaxID=75743 RepID=UPI003B5B197C
MTSEFGVPPKRNRLIKMLQIIRRNGLRLNKAKCQFGVKEIMFLRDRLSGQGIERDDMKIQAITNMPRHTDKKGVLRVLDMINFIGKFILNLSAKTACLRDILKKVNNFSWTEQREQEWIRRKKAPMTTPILTFLDPTKKNQDFH